MTPGSTYRVQVRPSFPLAAAAELAGYLRDLGATHLYSAPLLAAAPGSEHGYDVVDPARINDELGGEPALDRLVAELRQQGLGLVLDIVPNHLGVADAAANPYWWDVLAHGRESRYACWFDIDWSRGRLLLPVLGDDGLDALTVDGDELRYHEHRFPLAPGTSAGPVAEVHARQHYELVGWRRAATDLNYRRFFAISTLAGVRVEDPAVFEATHAQILRLCAAGALDGLRIDHPDGLRDPGGYLARLAAGAAGVWLVVEKILEPGEELPRAWPVAGTTGYDALREVCGLFIDPAAEDAFTALDTELTGVQTEYADLSYESKREVATGILGAEVARLERLAGGFRDQLVELLACFSVYRSYLPCGAEHLDVALDAARARSGLTFDELADRLRDPSDELAVRFQQVSGAVMAKGVEDTAFYRWTRFVALNEVGGDPSRFGVTPDEFHICAARRHQHWPAAMTALSTHDTKRGEDVRARLAVLSEIPDDWAALVRRWSAAAPLPDNAIAHLLWQTAIGAWPIEPDRLHAYLEKAAREAATATSWDNPDPGFEAALHAVVERLYDDPVLGAEVSEFATNITPYGWGNALGQKLLQLAAPGVPDTYQGTELWDDSLVDPDNRRPVDFDRRRALLVRIDRGWQPPIDETGAAKLLVTARTLRLRRDRPELFAGYEPLEANGAAAGHAVAFDRGGAVAVATRLPVGLERAGGWGDTALALPRDAVDVLTGASWPAGPARLAELLNTYPVALLADS